MQLSTASDYRCWDNTEQVTYSSARKGIALDVIPVAKRQQLTVKEQAASGGVYTGQDLHWLIPAPQLTSGFIPKPGDVVYDGDQNPWTVLEANPRRRDSTGFQTWRLTCRNLVLAYDLQDLIDIQRPAIVYDAAGVRVNTWSDDPQPAGPGGTTPYAKLPARVQLVEDETVDVRAIRGDQQRYEVFVGRQVTVFVTDRIKWTNAGNTVYLTIKGYRNPQRIDELPVIDALGVPGP